MYRKGQGTLQEEDVVDLQVLVAGDQENETEIEEAEDDDVVDVVDESWRTWHRKRKIGRRKISRSIPATTVWSHTRAWYFAQHQGMNLNLMVTVRPDGINDMPPWDRIDYWQTILNKIAQFGRDHGFTTAFIWSRESDPGTGNNEHLHVLVHIEPGLIERFKAVASGWFNDDGELGTAEIDIRRATYRVRWTQTHKQRSAITYITKNSPQAAHGTDRSYRKGGPILGKRIGCSRNIDETARNRHEAESERWRLFGHPKHKRDLAPGSGHPR